MPSWMFSVTLGKKKKFDSCIENDILLPGCCHSTFRYRYKVITILGKEWISIDGFKY